MRNIRRLLDLTVLCAVLSSSAIVAQQSSPTDAPQAPPPVSTLPPGPNATTTLRISSRLVVLDLVVEDAQGNIVPNLKREDFHVTEAGEPQNILNFDTNGAHTVPESVTIHSTQELDQLAPQAPVNIILLDEFNTRFEDMAFARYSLKKYLSRQPGQLSTPTMLIAVSLQKFEVLHDYTQNKDEILSALDHHFAVYPWQVHQGGWLAERYGTAFESLRRVAEAVVGHQGPKNMIWIGRGFPSLNFVNMQVDTQNRVENAVQQCVNELRDARVTLYTIDPAGVQVNNTYNTWGPDSFAADPFGGNYEFDRLAHATGGRTLYGRNDVDMEIGTAIRDGSSAYTLSYRPTSAVENPQKFRKIVVTVDRPGVKVYTREGYYLQRRPSQVNPVNPSRRLVADLISADTSTMNYDGVPLRLENTAAKPGDYIIHVDPRSLTWSPATDTEPRHTEVVLMVSTYDKKGKEIKRTAQVMKFSAPKTEPPTGRIERGLGVPFTLPPDPKAVRVRFTVRVSASGRIGTADAVPGQPIVASATPPPQPGASPSPLVPPQQ
jgi:VWFA-related protein